MCLSYNFGRKGGKSNILVKKIHLYVTLNLMASLCQEAKL